MCVCVCVCEKYSDVTPFVIFNIFISNYNLITHLFSVTVTDYNYIYLVIKWCNSVPPSTVRCDVAASVCVVGHLWASAGLVRMSVAWCPWIRRTPEGWGERGSAVTCQRSSGTTGDERDTDRCHSQTTAGAARHTTSQIHIYIINVFISVVSHLVIFLKIRYLKKCVLFLYIYNIFLFIWEHVQYA